MTSLDEIVNIGSKERPILVPLGQVVGERTSFWDSVASGGVLVGEPGGINLDTALRIAQAGKDVGDECTR